MPAEQRYRAADAKALAIVPLDVLTAVYDRRSGQTHVLASPLPEILAALGSGERSLAAIAVALAADFDLAPPASPQPGAGNDGKAAVEAAISAHLDELAGLGLVEVL